MTAALEGSEWSAARPGRTLPLGKTQYPFYKRLGGPQGWSGRAENLVSTGIRSRTVQPVVSCYTNWATRPMCTFNYSDKIKILIIRQLKYEIYSSTHIHTHIHNTHTHSHTHTHKKAQSEQCSMGRKDQSLIFINLFTAATRKSWNKTPESYQGL